MRQIRTVLKCTILQRQRVTNRVRHVRSSFPCPKHHNTLSPPSAAPRYQRLVASFSFRVIATTLVLATSIGAFSFATSFLHAEAPSSEPHCPKFRFAEVEKHGRDASKKWVTKGSKVYDITEWIPSHPDDEVILRVASIVINSAKKTRVFNVL